MVLPWYLLCNPKNTMVHNLFEWTLYKTYTSCSFGGDGEHVFKAHCSWLQSWWKLKVNLWIVSIGCIHLKCPGIVVMNCERTVRAIYILSMLSYKTEKKETFKVFNCFGVTLLEKQDLYWGACSQITFYLSQSVHTPEF